MDNTLTKLLKGIITLDQVVKELNLKTSQLSYLQQEVNNYRFGESTLVDTINRIKEFIL